jgi:hypothetical protein
MTTCLQPTKFDQLQVEKWLSISFVYKLFVSLTINNEVTAECGVKYDRLYQWLFCRVRQC